MLQPNFRKVAFIFDHSISIAFKSGLYGGRYVPRGCNWGAPYFNFRPSARGDRRLLERHFCAALFQFPPLREGRLRAWSCPCHSLTNFNSRPSARGDLETETDFYRQKFQFTPLREGRPIPKSVITDWFKFQFVPLREGRLSRNRSRLF